MPANSEFRSVSVNPRLVPRRQGLQWDLSPRSALRPRGGWSEDIADPSDVSRPGHTPHPLPVFLAFAMVAFSVVGMVVWHNFNYAVTCIAGAVALRLLETDRILRCPEVPWWMRHGAVLPWAALVVLPWTIRLWQGSWPVGTDGPLTDSTLPKVWLINILALVGLTCGSLTHRTRAPTPDPTSRPRVATWPLLRYFAVLAVALLVSYAVAGRPLSALWRLSGGGDLYGADVDTHTRLGALDLVPVAAVAMTLGVAAVRRQYRPTPPVAELVVLAATLVVTLGSGSRYRFLTVLIGWLLIQTRIGDLRREPGFGMAVIRTLLIPVLIIVTIGGLGIISARRAAVTGPTDVVKTAFNSFDLLGAEELIVERGASPGSLNLRTYLELPRQLTPRILTGGRRSPAATVEAIQTHLDPNVGYSMPYWFEATLNIGTLGAFLSGLAFAALLLRFLAGCAGSRFVTRRLFWPMGPATILFSYQVLSRVETEQLLSTCAALWVGAWFAARSTRLPSPAEQIAEPSDTPDPSWHHSPSGARTRDPSALPAGAMRHGPPRRTSPVSPWTAIGYSTSGD